MKLRSLFLLVPVFSAAVAFAACTDDDSEPNTGDGADAATADASGDAAPNEDGGAPVLPDDATRVVATSKGGFEAPVGDASTCQPQDATWTLELPGQVLSWKLCDPSTEDAGVDRGPTYAFREGQRTLTAEEYGPLRDAISAMAPSTNQSCGADKPDDRVAVTSPGGTVTYRDDFYACDPVEGTTPVTGMDAVIGQFRALTTVEE